jgi:hypothetical protein
MALWREHLVGHCGKLCDKGVADNVGPFCHQVFQRCVAWHNGSDRQPPLLFNSSDTCSGVVHFCMHARMYVVSAVCSLCCTCTAYVHTCEAAVWPGYTQYTGFD